MFFYDYPILGKEKELPLYLINMGLQECQDHIIRKEGYPCSQILFCTKGSGTLIIDKKKDNNWPLYRNLSSGFLSS
ncbi:MAG: hypothetical protein J6J00_04450 [Treponema sp.]|nr:hypothetical protein [Treponema sp.]